LLRWPCSNDDQSRQMVASGQMRGGGVEGKQGDRICE
jgi:hypothetical protein